MLDVMDFKMAMFVTSGVLAVSVTGFDSAFDGTGPDSCFPADVQWFALVKEHADNGTVAGYSLGNLVRYRSCAFYPGAF